MRIVCAIAAACALALTASGCGSSSAGGDGREDVVAAFYPLAFAAEQIGGDRVSVTNLTPPGAEPHDVELSPQDVAHLQRAEVVVYLGAGFQPAVEDSLDGAQGQKVDVLPQGDGADPHVWLDPVLFAGVVRRIGAALAEAGPAAALAGELEQLDLEYRAGLADCARRELVTSHAAFGRLAARYGLTQIPISGIEPEAEPSARTLSDLSARIRRDHVTTVFSETLVSAKVAETLAHEAGATTAVLNPIEGLTPDEADRGEDYFSLMRANLATLRKALGCR